MIKRTKEGALRHVTRKGTKRSVLVLRVTNSIKMDKHVIKVGVQIMITLNSLLYMFYSLIVLQGVSKAFFGCCCDNQICWFSYVYLCLVQI